MFAVGILLLAGCSQEGSKPGASNDLGKLKELVNLQIPIRSVRWEVFSTPEESGMLPTSPDITTLVAELDSDDGWFDSYKEPTGTTYIAPEAARPWVTAGFRQLLDENKNIGVDLSSKANCRKFAATLTKSGRPVTGFACNISHRILIYLTLWSETQAQ